MTLIRQDLTFDVTEALPASSAEGAMLTATVVADPEALPERPVVILAVPGGTYHRARMAVVAIAPIGHEGCGVRGGGEHIRVADNGFQCR